MIMAVDPLDLSIGGYALLAATLLTTLYITTAIRAWYPLRHVPAATWSAHFSYLWLARANWSGKLYWAYRDLHTTKGPLVRIGPSDIQTNDIEIIRWLNRPGLASRRSDWYAGARFDPAHHSILSMPDTAEHAEHKRKLAPAYHGRGMTNKEARVDEQVAALLALIRRKCAEGPAVRGQAVLDLAQLMDWFAADVVTRLGFGEALGWLRDEKDYFEFFGTLHRSWLFLGLSIDVPWLRKILFSKLSMTLFGPRSRDSGGFGGLLGVSEHYIKKRFEQEKPELGDDMLSVFISQGLSRKQCEIETLFMLLAGSEATATTARVTLLSLIASPRVFYRLKGEIDTAVRENRVSTPARYAEIQQLPYLRAVLYEGIRIRPSGLGLLPKLVPKGGMTTHGMHIPEGTAICMNLSSLLRSTELFGKDAYLFRPERFLEVDEKRRHEMENNTELVFGSGQFMCLGQKIAWLEMSKVVFELVKGFDMQIVSPWKPSNMQSYGAWVETNMDVNFTAL
ncbi:cytochrome P450 [Aspergillus carlsbadensis]|nr:cytochrome P450 [Aspergillus carlsbadensis]